MDMPWTFEIMQRRNHRMWQPLECKSISQLMIFIALFVFIWLSAVYNLYHLALRNRPFEDAKRSVSQAEMDCFARRNGMYGNGVRIFHIFSPFAYTTLQLFNLPLIFFVLSRYSLLSEWDNFAACYKKVIKNKRFTWWKNRYSKPTRAVDGAVSSGRCASLLQ